MRTRASLSFVTNPQAPGIVGASHATSVGRVSNNFRLSLEACFRNRRIRRTATMIGPRHFDQYLPEDQINVYCVRLCALEQLAQRRDLSTATTAATPVPA
jgi:hypothetical protein